jgi:hypothetical protein
MAFTREDRDAIRRAIEYANEHEDNYTVCLLESILRANGVGPYNDEHKP